MPEFLSWLRVTLLRLRSFDWGNGSWRMSDLKDGGMTFSSLYRVSELAKKLGISEDDILQAIDSPAVLAELEAKSFTLSWKEGEISIRWLEDGLKEFKTDVSTNYFEKDGKYYQKFRMIDKIVYLDGTERVIRDSGDVGPSSITEAKFMEALEQIRRAGGKSQESAAD